MSFSDDPLVSALETRPEVAGVVSGRLIFNHGSGWVCYSRAVAIVGERPETGVRIVIQREKSRAEPPWSYTGAAHLPSASFPLAVLVEAEGCVTVTLSPEPNTHASPPSDLAEKVRLIVRTIYRQAKSDDQPPAWRIVRWRGDK